MKKIISALLVVSMLLALVPTISFAASAFTVDFSVFEGIPVASNQYWMGKNRTGEAYGAGWKSYKDPSVSTVLDLAGAVVRFYPNYYMQIQQTKAGNENGKNVFAIDVTIPADAVYDISVNAGYCNFAGGMEIEIDGNTIGQTIDLYSEDTSVVVKPVTVGRNITLSGGVHRVNIVGKNSSVNNGDAQQIFLKSLSFAPAGEVGEVNVTSGKNYILLSDTDGEKLTVSAKYSNGEPVNLSDATVELSSSDTSIATVSSDGTVIPHKAGKVTITAKVTVGTSSKSGTYTFDIIDETNLINTEFEIDFSTIDMDALGGDRLNAGGTANGDIWSFDSNKAVSTLLNNNNCVRFYKQGNPPYVMLYFYVGHISAGKDSVAINFTAPETGMYDILTNALYGSSCGMAEFYLDGTLLASPVDLYAESAEGIFKEAAVAPQVLVTKGEHTLKIKAKRSVHDNDALLGFSKIMFKNRGGVASAEIKYDKKFILLSDTDGEKLTVSAKYESGFGVDIDKDAKVTFETSDPNVAAVSEDGVVTPVACGDVVISAEVAVGSSSKSAELALKISEEAVYDNFVIDFTNQTAPTAYEATIETNGWEINREKTDKYLYSTSSGGTDITRYQTYGLQIQALPRKQGDRDNISFNFVVPSTGNYDIEFCATTGPYGGVANIYIDGKFVGEFDFYHLEGESSVTKLLRSLSLTGGEIHTLTFYAVKSGPNTAQLHPTKLTFTGTGELNPVVGLGAEMSRKSIAVGESEEFRLYVLQQNGAKWFVKAPFFGTDNVSLIMTSGNAEIAKVDSGLIKAVASGNAEMSISGNIEGKPVSDSFAFNVNENIYDHAEIDAVYDVFYEDGKTEIFADAYLSDGTLVNKRDITWRFESDDEEVATIDGNTLCTHKEGTATITAYVTFNGITLDASETINVVPVALEKIAAEAEDKVISIRDTDGSKLIITGTNNDGSVNLLEGATYSFESLTPEIAEVTDSGYVIPVSRGTGKIKVTAHIGGLDFECVAEVISSSQKTEPTIYTYEMRENALENIKKYSWAKSVRDSAVEKADEYIAKLDEIYNLITYEGIPRAHTLGLSEDPDSYKCVYCGTDIRDKYGMYAWGVNPLARPWKIQCPDCKRLFPSNEFEKFYELGLDKKGQFDRFRALEAHRTMLLEKGEIDTSVREPGEEWSEDWYAYYGYGKGYLENKLYKDVDEGLGVDTDKVLTWAVDDGQGWYTGEKLASGAPVLRAFVAFYHHDLYYRSDGTIIGYMNSVFTNLRDAYLYTGDIKYGRAGAILLDRMADVYPSFDRGLNPLYQNSDGVTAAGKILGSIWEHDMANLLVRSYDAFYPAMEDSQVIKYLSEKASELGLENPKTNADMIRENAEYGIVREAGNAVRRAQIWGNFGMHQYAMTLAAVALDTFPETAEMLDWLIARESFDSGYVTQYGVEVRQRQANNGGGMFQYFINNVDRDGFGWEVGAGYNQSWLMNPLNMAEVLYRYGEYEKLNLYENAKYRKMFDAIIHMTMAGDYTVQLGDFRSTAGTSNDTSKWATLIAFKRLGDPKFAQMIYHLKGGNLEETYIDIFEKDAENIQDEIKAVVEEYGEYKFESRNKTGFGLTVLSGGELISKDNDFRRDAWIWYGRSDKGHGHQDQLQLGIDAYGFNFTPDLGYPDATMYSGNTYQWVRNTLSHNTVVVDGDWQKGVRAANPLHYEDAGMVKIADVDASNAYDQTDIYRRTVVSVDASSEVAYTVDFFRVKGGTEHVYSFHTQSADGVTATDLNLVKQVDKDGNYIGTYAGSETEYGDDPYTDSSTTDYKTKYPRGYTWLKNVRRDETPVDGNFSVNFKQKDFKKQVANANGLNLKFTALNDWIPTSVGIAVGEPPRIVQNAMIPYFDYMLIHNKAEAGEELDTLFTSVIQPYKGEEYIERMESVALTSSGGERTDDTSKAVKVTLKSGRVDYIIYATNPDVTYNVSDMVNGHNVTFDFAGFVGVYSINQNGKNVYAYVNDGGKIGDITATARYTGNVVSFTDDNVSENFITVTVNEDVSDEEITALAGRYIYIDNGGNGAYKIEGASRLDEKSILLDIGDVTLIKAYMDDKNLSRGYIFNIEPEQTFTIPLSAKYDGSPQAFTSGDVTTSAGSSVSTQVSATSPEKEKITFVGTVLPRGASINAETGKVTWKPDASQVGENGFLITARDESGREDSVSFTVTVYGATTGNSGNNNDNSSDDKDTGSDDAGTAGGGGGGGGGGAAPTDKPEDTATTDKPDAETEKDDENVIGENAPDASGKTESLRFTDLGNHAWAAEAINVLAADGIIKGTSVSTFSPAANITRADFALLLVRAFGLTSDNTENFADVSASDYFAPELAIARNTGIVAGVGDNKYAPRNTITRQDMMVIVYRAMQKLNVEFGAYDEPQYPDFDTVADYAKEAVSALIGAGLVNGKNGRIAPTDYTTRAEVAVLIKRILDFIK